MTSNNGSDKILINPSIHHNNQYNFIFHFYQKFKRVSPDKANNSDAGSWAKEKWLLWPSPLKMKSISSS